MKKDVLELTIEEFVRVLCGMEKTYTVYLKHFPITTNEKEREIVGTYSQIHDLFTDLSIANPENESARDALKYVEETLFDYGTELSDLDIYDYLEEKTKGFTQERCRIVLKEMEMYHSMYVDEERSSYVKEKIKNGWEEYKTIKIESVCDKPVTISSFLLYNLSSGKLFIAASLRLSTARVYFSVCCKQRTGAVRLFL